MAGAKQLSFLPEMLGVKRLKNGWWHIDPVHNSYSPRGGSVTKSLRHFSDEARKESKRAPSPLNAYADALDNALAEAEFATGKYTQNPNMRVLVNVSPSGTKADAALAYDIKEAHEQYDFPHGTNYLKWVGAPVPGKGREGIRTMQDVDGNKVALQAWMGGPTDNIAGYQNMGFQFAEPTMAGDDALGGHRNLPAMEIFRPVKESGDIVKDMLIRYADGDLIEQPTIPRKADPRQLKLFTDFKRGGLAALRGYK
jgi:hypothetical protein